MQGGSNVGGYGRYGGGYDGGINGYGGGYGGGINGYGGGYGGGINGYGGGYGGGINGYGGGYVGGINGYGGGYGGGINGYGGGYGGGINGYGGGYVGGNGGYGSGYVGGNGGYGGGYGAAHPENAVPLCCTCSWVFDAAHSDLAVNICAQCLRSRFLFSYLTKYVCNHDFITHKYLYMVLETNEDPLKGLNAKDKFAFESVKRHLYNSKYSRCIHASQYISTFTSLESADLFAKEFIIKPRDQEPKRIVQIKVSQLHTATFIDFSNYYVHDILLQNPVHLFNTHMDFNYASISNQVLVVGHIPACAISAIKLSDRNGLKCICMNKFELIKTKSGFSESSDLVLNICADCLKNLKILENSSPLYQLSLHVNTCESLMFKHPYLYRVLRKDEDPSTCLKAKNELSTESIKRHVALGSRKWMESQYISTCTSLEKAMEFAEKGIEHNDPLPKRIVEIDVSLLPMNIFIDFSNPETCKDLLYNPTDGLGQMAYNFASSFKEVLVVGRIPAYAITAKHKKCSKQSSWEPYDD